MAKLHNGDPCPRCGKAQVYRVRRRNWMRWLPDSKHYKCGECRGRFLTVRRWTIRLRAAKQRPYENLP